MKENLIKIAAVLVVLGLVFTGGYMVKGRSADRNLVAVTSEADKAAKVSKSFITALTTGEVTEAYGVTTTAYKAKNSRERVEAIGKTLRSDSPIIKDEEVYTGPQNKAIYLATVDNLPANEFGRTTGNFVINLQFDGGEWKIDSSQTY